MDGLIIKAQSGFFTVRTPQGADIVCHLRGKLKQKRQDSDLATVGDQVTITLLDETTGMIETVHERVRTLARRRPSPKGRGSRTQDDDEHQSIIMANPDQVVLVFACAEPAPRLGMLDRFLIVAESNKIPVILCANKYDLITPAAAEESFSNYRTLGYTLLYTSTVTGEGVADLQALLRGKISALSGPSGVGKSSLLNAIQPQLGIKVKAVSKLTQKGRHTTVHPELIPLTEGGWVADTPGIRSFALYDIDPYELDGYFREISPYVGDCTFNNCSHTQEQGCAVRAAVTQGQIHPRRYESYLRIRAGQEN